MRLDSAESVLLDGQARGLVQLTSSLRFPTFKAGRGFSGDSPKILDNAVFRRHFVDFLGDEAKRWGDAAVLPLGNEPAKVADALAARGVIRRENICPGLLHPSRNNSYRLKWILGDRTGVRPDRTDPTAYDAGRRRFQDVLPAS